MENEFDEINDLKEEKKYGKIEKRGKKKKTKKILLIILAVFLAIVIALVSAFFILFFKGKSQFHKDDTNIKNTLGIDDLEINEDDVIYKDETYTLDRNVVSVLFIGIDKENLNKDFGYGQNGQSDSLFVAAVNTKTKKIKLIPIAREAMVDINCYSDKGKFIGTEKKQICLAYSYGDSADKSCDNVKKSVVRYLMGINVSNYIAMDLEGIGKVTDKIGGVKLNAIESVEIDGKMCKIGDSLNLKGDNARSYVQSRTEDIMGSSLRLGRQKQFLSAFASTAGNQILNDFTKLKVYYDSMIPYIKTDLSFSQISYLVSSCLTKDIGSALQYEDIKGTMQVTDKWVEFTPDSDSLITAILDAFYIKNN